jgi:1-phosphatidylinositol-3-phosphate 5-kinase
MQEKLPMIRHFRSYAHSHGRVNVIIEEFGASASGDKITMWSYCKICKEKTPEVTMSDETWRYSFGKYLELIFYMEKATCSGLSSCEHDLHREHVNYFVVSQHTKLIPISEMEVRFFGLRNYAVRFEYETIDLLEVFVPPMRLLANSDVTVGLKNEDFEVIR